jgi:hypothetical protein
MQQEVFCMNTRRTIQRVGFRKWYERELLQSHGHLVLLIFCVLALLGAAELYAGRAGWLSQLSALLCAGVSAVVGFWALRRYMYLLGHAQHVADQAFCPACHVYARWNIEDDAQEGAPEQRLRVRCRGCSNVWHIAL